VGKIANALEKYARERKSSQIPGLARADLEVLAAYDRDTCHLINYHPEDGQMNRQSTEALRNRGTVQRLLANKLIYPNGRLTPKGLRECERLEKAAREDVRPVETDAQNEKDNPNDRPTPPVVVAESGQSRQVPGPASPHMQPISDEAEHLPPTVEPIGDISGRLAEKPDETKWNHMLVSALEPNSYVAEQFKILRTSLLYPIKGQPPKSILITSALPGEGKSFVAANLSVSIALDINKHVLLMDCDMRKPNVHRQFNIGETPGLNEYLIKERELSSLLVRTAIDKLTILPGGEPPQNPSELLSSERMAALIHEVKHRYSDRLIVIDSPPTNLAAETGFLAREVDSVIVVVRDGKTPRRDIEDLLELVEPDKIIGLVLNRVDTPLKRKYGYSYRGYRKYGGYYSRKSADK
jgi:exopolysaccharide/PEP-CTERM locus tyrosine autokinase